jgi:hypothetical protein
LKFPTRLYRSAGKCERRDCHATRSHDSTSSRKSIGESGPPRLAGANPLRLEEEPAGETPGRSDYWP